MVTIRTCTDELVQHRDKHQATSNSANPPTVRNHKSLKLALADFGFLYCDFISFNAQINMRAFYTFYLFQHNTGSSSRWLHVFACEVFVHEMIEMWRNLEFIFYRIKNCMNQRIMLFLLVFCLFYSPPDLRTSRTTTIKWEQQTNTHPTIRKQLPTVSTMSAWHWPQQID